MAHATVGCTRACARAHTHTHTHYLCSLSGTDLEALMRATLGALANFNEDERMILTRSVSRGGSRGNAIRHTFSMILTQGCGSGDGGGDGVSVGGVHITSMILTRSVMRDCHQTHFQYDVYTVCHGGGGVCVWEVAIRPVTCMISTRSVMCVCVWGVLSNTLSA